MGKREKRSLLWHFPCKDDSCIFSLPNSNITQNYSKSFNHETKVHITDCLFETFKLNLDKKKTFLAS